MRHDEKHTPLINYKFAQTYAALKALAETGEGSPYDGISVEYVNPLTGRPGAADDRVLREPAARRPA